MTSAEGLQKRRPDLDVDSKRTRLSKTFQFVPGPLHNQLRTDAIAAERAATGLWRRDPSVWSEDDATKRSIANRLGWLSSPVLMAESIERLTVFAESVRRGGFTDVVLLGMGGSSLAPEVLRAVLGVAPGWPQLRMLDSTDPAAVRAASTPPERTLYLLASKSGTTIEPNNSYRSQGHLPVLPPDRPTASGVTLTLTAAAREKLGAPSPEQFLTLVRPGDYVGLLAYVGPDEELAAELKAFRLAVRDRTRAATMFGYGPRYLHSTGQLHKGGPNSGVFVLITATPRADLPIPDETFSFGTLELAQALGDFASLDATGRRALHVHLPAPDRRLVREIADGLLSRLPTAR